MNPTNSINPVNDALRTKQCNIFHQYTIRVLDGRRDELRGFLKEQGIGTFIYYPLSLHLQECFHELGYNEGDLPESERASKEVLSLPVFPELLNKEIDFIIEAIKQYFTRGEIRP